MYVCQSCRHGNLFPVVVPHEVPFYEQNAAYISSIGRIALQSDSPAYHFSAAIVADMLHRGDVQDSGYF